MRRSFRFKIGIFLGIILAVTSSAGAAYSLGQLYLRIVKESSFPKTTRVVANTSPSVSVQDATKLLYLNPVPVYFLQAGVYSTLEGASAAAEPFEQLGYKPYITETVPFKLWIGVFEKRSDVEIIKQRLRDKGYGSFTGAVVLNGTNLRYGKGTEAFIKEMTPALQLYTSWLRENLALFHAGEVDQLDWSLIEKQESVITKLYLSLKGEAAATSNNQLINERIGHLNSTIDGYEKQLDVFLLRRSQDSFMLLQWQLLSFIDNYGLLMQEIENISKT